MVLIRRNNGRSPLDSLSGGPFGGGRSAVFGGGGGFGATMHTLIVEVDDSNGTAQPRMEAILASLGQTWRIQDYSVDQSMAKIATLEGVLGTKAVGGAGAVRAVGKFEITTMDLNMSPSAFVSLLQSRGITVFHVGVAASPPPRPMAPRFDPMSFARGTYIPTEVQCSMCKATFIHTELIDDSKEAAQEEFGYGSKQTCPRCGAPDCCEIEFEK